MVWADGPAGVFGTRRMSIEDLQEPGRSCCFHVKPRIGEPGEQLQAVDRVQVDWREEKIVLEQALLPKN